MTKRNTIYRALLCVVIALVTLLSSIGVAYGRYNRVVFSSVVCGAPQADASTLTADKKIYDFGCWQLGQTGGFAHTVILEQNEPLQGTLRFVWDVETVDKADITALPTGEYSGSGGVYTINEADGRLEFPFALFFSSTTRCGSAYLDVELIPQGQTAATASARYLVMLNPYSVGQSVGNAVPAVSNNTAFLTDRLMRLCALAPGSCGGVVLAAGANVTDTFAAGTVYYNNAHPRGVTLVQDSVLYLPANQEGMVDAVIAWPQTPAQQVQLAVGVSQTNFTLTRQTPAAATAAIELSAKGTPVVSRTGGATITLQVPDTLPDSQWNTQNGSVAELTWQVQRLQGGQFTDVACGTDLVAAVMQTATEGTITVTAPTGRQPAGTYRLKCTQHYNGCSIATAETWFFIDYRG